jgi:ParB-like chromosome segregation protein Spo0J
VVVVTPSSDGWLIIDGQHRVEAARRCKLMTVPCVIVPAASVEEQAEIFLGLNRTRVPINPYAIHAARVAAGEADAVATAELALAAGIDIPRYPIPQNKLKPGQTMALSTIAKAAGDKMGAAAVRIVGECWAKRPGGIPAAVLRAAWLALDQGLPEAAIRTWLGRQEHVSGQMSHAVIGEIVAKIRRLSNVRANVAPGVDPSLLVRGR